MLCAPSGSAVVGVRMELPLPSVEMVADNPAYLLTPRELATHGPAVKKKPRAQKPTP